MDPIPRAYLAALENVDVTEGQQALYYDLWPRQTSLASEQRRKPQSELFPYFCKLMIQEDFRVFFSGGTRRVPFSQSSFLEPEFKRTNTGQIAFRVLEQFWEKTIWNKNALVDLPYETAVSILNCQREDFTNKFITEELFFCKFLFPKIECQATDLKDTDRNALVLHALLSDNTVLENLVKHHDCIPCEPKGHLQSPNHLIHPKGVAAQLYSAEDNRFPMMDGVSNFRSPLALTKLEQLGMIKDRISTLELEHRARTVKTLHGNASVARAAAIIKYVAHYFIANKELFKCFTLKISNIAFLPVLQKPSDWPIPLPWFGEDKDFAEPIQLFSQQLKDLSGCVEMVLDDTPLDLSETEWKTLEHMGFTRFKSSSPGTRLTEITIKNLLAVSLISEKDLNEELNVVKIMCTEMYKYLDSNCCDTKQLRSSQDIIAGLKEKEIVLSAGKFWRAKELAFKPRIDMKPYLNVLDNEFMAYKTLFSFLGVKQRFFVEDVLFALRMIKEHICMERLLENDMQLIRNIVQLLVEVLRIKGGPDAVLSTENTQDISLPGRDGYLHPISELCLNDCDWVEESGTMCFLHSDFSESMGRVFGVRTMREHDENEFSESFGQHEELTDRINRLLEGYTRDSSVFKELLQNADDAKATEVFFIKDYRLHSTDHLMMDTWTEIMGPALCIYNDACFTPKDIKGIQALGAGSKEEDTLKIGKYGVGFNAVYNLTDTPCFLTTVVPEEGFEAQEDDNRLGERLCLMDPNFFVTSPKSKLPGKLMKINDRFKKQYSDMTSPFQFKFDTINTTTGTVFRLPLRKRQRDPTQIPLLEASNRNTKSKIRQPAVSMKDIKFLLKSFQSEAGESLLFLNNVRKVAIYTIQRVGTVVLDFETSFMVKDSDLEKQKDFFCHVQKEVRRLKTEGSRLTLNEFSPKSVSLLYRLSDSTGHAEDWLVVNKFGLSKSDYESSSTEKLFNLETIHRHKLLPQAGVAVCLSPENRKTRLSAKHHEKKTKHKLYANKTCHLKYVYHNCLAYCSLPLPVTTGLPVHVNGRFALDNETRRNINTETDILHSWNKLLAEGVIVPAYVAALCEVRLRCFSREEISLTGSFPEDLPSENGLLGNNNLLEKLEHYNNLFPVLTLLKADKFWCSFIISFYKRIAEKESYLFPVVRCDLDKLLWSPAVKAKGFPCYFWDERDVAEKIDRHNALVENATKQLKCILLELNMNITESSLTVFQSFEASNVKTVRKLSDTAVIEFLLSSNDESDSTDTCNLKELPKPVELTTLRSTENVIDVFSFIRSVVNNLQGLPLSLRMSGELHYFGPQYPVIVSPFCELLPGSQTLFLHKSLLGFVENQLKSQHTSTCILQHLSLERFVELLPQTLSDDVFAKANIIALSEHINALQKWDVDISKWLQQLWTYIQSISNDGFREHGSGIDNWSLIPAVKEGKCFLLPFKKRDHIVHTVKAGTFGLTLEHTKINEIIAKLPVYMLNEELTAFNYIATEKVASVSKPAKLLIALTVEDLKNTLKHSEATQILEYFSHNLPTDDIQYKYASRLLCLPFFEKPDGSFCSLGIDRRHYICVPDRIPRDGLSAWATERNISLVKSNYSLIKLYKALNVQIPSESDFYLNYFLPDILCISNTDIPIHMEFIRDSVIRYTNDQLLLAHLKTTRFIQGPDNTRSIACDFFDPDCKVFKEMLPPDSFPPNPYVGNSWRRFLLEIGLVSQVSAQQFIQYATNVAESGKVVVVTKIERQSEVLVHCLRDSQNLRDIYFLKQLQMIKFVRPLLELQNGCLSNTSPVFKSQTPLISFSEGYSQNHAALVWASACVLPDYADPNRFVHWSECQNELIGFKSVPPPEIVKRNLSAICQSMDIRNEAGEWEKLSQFTDNQLDETETIMEESYKYLSSCSGELKDIINVPLIFHKKRKAVFNPLQVVINITKEEIVDGLVVDAPETLGKHFELFRRIGVRDQVTADHYARALMKLHSQIQENVLNPNDVNLVKDSVNNLFKVLKTPTIHNQQFSVSTLYLPAEDISMLTANISVPEVRLISSNDIVAYVDGSQRRRIKEPLKDILVFVEFQRLGLKAFNLHRDTKLLPPQYQMKQWQDIVKETLEENCKARAYKDEETETLESMLHLPECAAVVKRLVNHEFIRSDKPFSECDEEKIDNALCNIEIYKVKDLKTVLCLLGSILHNTALDRQFFYLQGNSAGAAKVTLYVNSDQKVSIDLLNRDLAQYVHTIICKVIGVQFSSDIRLDTLLAKLERAQEEMDSMGICRYDENRQRRDFLVFPLPGTYVPEHLHCLLDHDINEFRVSEYVAYEVFDPCCDTSDSDAEANGSSESDKASFQNTASMKKAVYIFAKIMQVIPPTHDQNYAVKTRLVLTRYLIQIGTEEPPLEVEASKLYKFIRPKTRQMAVYTGNVTPSPDTGPEDLKEVLKALRQQLRDIWTIFKDDTRRKRAIKRLLLKWHPDKNPGREKFCTTVFQHIQKYVEALEQGKSLSDSDSEDVDVEDGVRSASSASNKDSSGGGRWWRRRGRGGKGGGGSFSAFFDQMFYRGREEAKARASEDFYGDSWGRSSSYSFSFNFTSSGRNPQPEEAKRWLTQARRDLEAARQTRDSGSQHGVFNWACYQAHQAVEKALKAVLYRRDAYNCMRTSHSITDIACSVGDADVMRMVGELDQTLGYHTRMRYPDVSEFPKIPSEIYDADKAECACRLSEAIVERAGNLIGVYRTPPPSPPPPPRPQPQPQPSSSRAISPPRDRSRSHAISGSSSSGSIAGAFRPAIEHSKPSEPKKARLALMPP